MADQPTTYTIYWCEDHGPSLKAGADKDAEFTDNKWFYWCLAKNTKQTPKGPVQVPCNKGCQPITVYTEQALLDEGAVEAMVDGFARKEAAILGWENPKNRPEHTFTELIEERKALWREEVEAARDALLAHLRSEESLADTEPDMTEREVGWTAGD